MPKGGNNPDDLEISPKSVPTQVHTPHIPNQDAAKQPTKLQEFIETDLLDGDVQTKSESGKSCGQLLDTITLDTGQVTDTNVLVAVLGSTPAQLIVIKEIRA
ncbi:hypothetical protein ACFX2J_004340 [Malus domestica]